MAATRARPWAGRAIALRPSKARWFVQTRERSQPSSLPHKNTGYAQYVMAPSAVSLYSWFPVHAANSSRAQAMPDAPWANPVIGLTVSMLLNQPIPHSTR